MTSTQASMDATTTTTTSTNTTSLGSALDGLPKPFVNAMRTLFDIMDDQRSGYVKLSEIERRWQDDGAQGLPRDVLPSLRKVTPADGYLSFERFCAGLQISLLRNKSQDRAPPHPHLHPHPKQAPPPPPPTSAGAPPPMQPPPPPPPHPRPPSAPLLDQQSQQPLQAFLDTLAPFPHITRPPHLHLRSTKSEIKMGVGGVLAGPPKPPRATERGRGTHSLDRNLDGRVGGAGDGRGATHSLDRVERRWEVEWAERGLGRERDIQQGSGGGDSGSGSGGGGRRERGASLERLLDQEERGERERERGVLGVPLRKVGIRSALQTWHKERTRADGPSDSNNNKMKGGGGGGGGGKIVGHRKELRETRSLSSVVGGMEPVGRGVGDGGDGGRGSGSGGGGVGNGTSGGVVPISTTTAHHHPDPQPQPSTSSATGSSASAAPPQQKKSGRKREARRHTLQNGIDTNMLCRLKQLEAERDMLVQGCEVVERARAWYREQLQAITERIHCLPHAGHRMEPSLEVQQEKLHFQLARIHEVNAHLTALMTVGEGGGLSNPMNLPLAPSSAPSAGPAPSLQPPNMAASRGHQEERRLVSRLKDQNHLLTEEVSNKSERITILEREKAALLRELLQPRPPPPSHHPLHPTASTSTAADSTFM
ncbi:homeobox protein Hox-A3-like [Eriocheir sinensis]|uniref:homeobox protein Hox-A3-like n=1 Tax=Eriocheir sinensis TaxID=95602 RepID=UPI0021C98DC5|nr:homeobox protein Hox-A3-like [Eriocheir sinensis]